MSSAPSGSNDLAGTTWVGMSKKWLTSKEARTCGKPVAKQFFDVALGHVHVDARALHGVGPIRAQVLGLLQAEGQLRLRAHEVPTGCTPPPSSA